MNSYTSRLPSLPWMWPLVALLWSLLAAACATNPSGPGDTSTDLASTTDGAVAAPEAGSTADLAVGPDAAVAAPEAGSTADLALGPDGAVAAPEAGSTPDLAVGPDAVVSTDGAPPVKLGDTILFGTCPGGTSQTYADNVYANYGKTHRSWRAFDSGFPTSWSKSSGSRVRASWPVAIVVQSMKPGINAKTAGGSVDALLKTFVASIPKVAGRTYILTLHHEPENDSSNSLYDDWYRQLLKRYATIIAAAGRPDIKSATILMGWTLSPKSGRNPKDWYVADVDVLGWDAYHVGQMIDCRNYSKAKGKPWMVNETARGSLLNKPDATYLAGIKEYWKVWVDPVVAHPPIAVQYFHATVGGTYPLFDVKTVFNNTTIPARPLSRQYWQDLQAGNWKLHH